MTQKSGGGLLISFTGSHRPENNPLVSVERSYETVFSAGRIQLQLALEALEQT